MTSINEFGFNILDSLDEFGISYFSGLSEKGNHSFDIVPIIIDTTYIKYSSKGIDLRLSSKGKQLGLQSNSVLFTG